MIGKVLSDRVQALVEILGDLAWVIIGLIVTILLGWQLVRHIRPSSEKQQPKYRPIEVLQEEII
jgi:TRAP-type mannitol/chloroaromatic compound transport system permease small subunit